MGCSRILGQLLVACTLAASLLPVGGCANCSLPRIDPTGEHVFICPKSQPAALAATAPPVLAAPPVQAAPLVQAAPPCAPPCGASSCGAPRPVQAAPVANRSFKMEPDPFGHKRYYARVDLSPRRIIAPVGTEVVVTAGVCGPDGYLYANERVEWQIAPGSVGQFMGLGQRAGMDWLLGSSRPEKLSNTYVVGTTSSKNLTLNRGTPARADDVSVYKGQAWVTVSSPLEGVSRVTAFVPNVFAWDQRQKTSTIYWVDAEWVLPPPSINPAGTRHTFTTTVTRHTTHCPVAGWRVRYQIVSGPAAGFAPDGRQVIEVPTNGLGQASAEIFQVTPTSGTNQVQVQVLRPADVLGGDGTELIAGEGMTSKTWSAADHSPISVRMIGPSQGAPGATLTYRLEVRNPGTQVAKDVVVNQPTIAGLTLISSNPPATLVTTNAQYRPNDLPTDGANTSLRAAAAGNTLQWRLGDLQPREVRTLEANYRADTAGTINACATVTTSTGVTAQDCTTTTILVPSIEVRVVGPAQIPVGQEVSFTATITNRGNAPAIGLVVVDRFDAGLKHAVSASPIERDLPNMQPGESRVITIKFQAIAPGSQCNTVEVSGQGSVRASGQACVNVTPVAAPPVTPPVAPTPAQPAAPPGVKPTLSVTKTGPTSKAVGDVAEFIMDISNTGTVPATNLKIADNYDLALDPVSATDGHSFAGDDLIWIVDTLPPGKTIRFQVNCRCLSPAANACNRITVTSQEGARADGQACLAITGPSTPLSMSVSDTRDPVAIGNDTTYQVTISNPNSVADTNVQVIATLSAELAPSTVGSSGPTSSSIQGQTVQFAPVAQLAAGATLTFSIQAHGATPGTGRVHVQVTSGNMPSPLAADQTTTVFANP